LLRIYNILKNALFPPVCKACGRFFHVAIDGRDPAAAKAPAGLEALFRRLMAEHLCHGCLKRFEAAESPICVRCGLIFKSRQGGDHLCGECLGGEKPFGIARAAGVYDQALMAVIHAFKYKGRIQLGPPLADLLAALYKRHWRERTIDLVIPVPLHPSRYRARGFNQAYLLTRSWGDPVDQGVLVRRRKTASQTGLGRRKRLTNIRGAFSVKSPAKVKNRRILLVDDVYTTGSTVNECARTLLKGGAREVDILTLARAV